MKAPSPSRVGLSARLVASHLVVAAAGVISVAVAVLLFTRAAAGDFVEQLERIQAGRGPGFVPPGIARQQLVAGEEFQGQVTQAALIGGAVAVALATLLALLIASRLARPVRTSSAAALRLASGERHVTLPRVGVAELDDLGTAMEKLGRELDALEQQRDRMVDDVTHELRTPLAVLRGHVEGMRDGVVLAGPETYERLLGELRRLERLVLDLRATMDVSPASLALEPVEVGALVTEAASRLRLAADSAGIAIAMEIEPATVDADRDRLGQVLDNLLTNALAQAPRGSTVTLRTMLRAADAVLEVRDEGPGLTAPEQSLVFERFYRTDAARDRGRGGAGIGLAVTRRIVEAHGGQVGVRSQPGAGATFWVALPLTRHTT